MSAMRRNLHKTLGLQRIKHDLAAHLAPAWRTSEVESVPGRRCESSLGELRPTPFAAPEAIVELLGKCQKKNMHKALIRQKIQKIRSS